MYIRKKTKQIKGQKYEQHQLLKSIRTSSGPRQEVLLNLGILDIAKDQWKMLADTIEGKLNNQLEISFLSNDPEIEKLADHFAQMIISKELNKQNEIKKREELRNKEKQEKPLIKEKEYERVDINSTRTTESKSIGAEYVVLDQMKRYEFDDILKSIGMNAKQVDYAKHLIVGRAVHPSSERELSRWVNENSGIKELIGSNEKVYDNALHRTAVSLSENKKEIEGKLRKKARDLFYLNEKIILYDLTNTYFEGRKEGSKIAQYGRSKEKRNDCKLATLALVVDGEGFPIESKILEGNISEPQTLGNILKEIKEMGERGEKKTVVIDAGIATDKNIALIKEEGMFYVAISRKQKYETSLWEKSEEKQIVLKDKKTKLKLKLAIVDINKEEKEAYLLCQSPQKEIKEKQILEKRMLNFEQSLKNLHEGLKKSRSQKRYAKIIERIGRLKEKYQVGPCFDIEVKHKNNIVQEILFKKNPKGKAKLEKSGEYVIRTNRLDLQEKDISCVHRSLSLVENSFRSMKSELGMRPNYHKNEDTIIAHIFITVIAYHMVCSILKRLADAGLNYSWNTIRNVLESHDRVVTAFNTDDDHCIYIRNTTTANFSQKEIYNKLRINHDPLTNIKLKRKIQCTQKM